MADAYVTILQLILPVTCFVFPQIPPFLNEPNVVCTELNITLSEGELEDSSSVTGKACNAGLIKSYNKTQDIHCFIYKGDFRKKFLGDVRARRTVLQKLCNDGGYEENLAEKLAEGITNALPSLPSNAISYNLIGVCPCRCDELCFKLLDMMELFGNCSRDYTDGITRFRIMSICYKMVGYQPTTTPTTKPQTTASSTVIRNTTTVSNTTVWRSSLTSVTYTASQTTTSPRCTQFIESASPSSHQSESSGRSTSASTAKSEAKSLSSGDFPFISTSDVHSHDDKTEVYSTGNPTSPVTVPGPPTSMVLIPITVKTQTTSKTTSNTTTSAENKHTYTTTITSNLQDGTTPSIGTGNTTKKFSKTSNGYIEHDEGLSPETSYKDQPVMSSVLITKQNPRETTSSSIKEVTSTTSTLESDVVSSVDDDYLDELYSPEVDSTMTNQSTLAMSTDHMSTSRPESSTGSVSCFSKEGSTPCKAEDLTRKVSTLEQQSLSTEIATTVNDQTSKTENENSILQVTKSTLRGTRNNTDVSERHKLSDYTSSNPTEIGKSDYDTSQPTLTTQDVTALHISTSEREEVTSSLYMEITESGNYLATTFTTTFEEEGSSTKSTELSIKSSKSTLKSVPFVSKTTLAFSTMGNSAENTDLMTTTTDEEPSKETLTTSNEEGKPTKSVDVGSDLSSSALYDSTASSTQNMEITPTATKISLETIFSKAITYRSSDAEVSPKVTNEDSKTKPLENVVSKAPLSNTENKSATPTYDTTGTTQSAKNNPEIIISSESTRISSSASTENLSRLGTENTSKTPSLESAALMYQTSRAASSASDTSEVSFYPKVTVTDSSASFKILSTLAKSDTSTSPKNVSSKTSNSTTVTPSVSEDFMESSHVKATTTSEKTSVKVFTFESSTSEYRKSTATFAPLDKNSKLPIFVSSSATELSSQMSSTAPTLASILDVELTSPLHSTSHSMTQVAGSSAVTSRSSTNVMSSPSAALTTETGQASFKTDFEPLDTENLKTTTNTMELTSSTLLASLLSTTSSAETSEANDNSSSRATQKGETFAFSSSMKEKGVVSTKTSSTTDNKHLTSMPLTSTITSAVVLTRPSRKPTYLTTALPWFSTTYLETQSDYVTLPSHSETINQTVKGGTSDFMPSTAEIILPLSTDRTSHSFLQSLFTSGLSTLSQIMLSSSNLSQKFQTTTAVLETSSYFMERFVQTDNKTLLTTPESTQAPIFSTLLDGKLTPLMGETTTGSLTTDSGPREQCASPCPFGYEQGEEFCYRVLDAKKSKTYRRAFRSCQEEPFDSDLAGEKDLKNHEFKEILESLRETRKPLPEKFFVNEQDTRHFTESGSVRIVTMKGTTRVFLAVVNTTEPNTHFGDVYGVCKTPKYCSPMRCNLSDYESYDAATKLVLPSNHTMNIGESFSAVCDDDGIIRNITITCNARGSLLPHPTNVNCSHNYDLNNVEEVLENLEASPSMQRSCEDCHELGTSDCSPGPEGYRCTCKSNWTGPTCWKSPDQCKLTNLQCGPNGTCVSAVDQAYCVCNEGYGGAVCEIAKSKLSFAENESSVINSVREGATALTFSEFITLVLKGAMKLYFPKSGRDTQVYYQNLRSFVLCNAGLIVLLFHHPALFDLSRFHCSMWSYMITTMYSLGIGFLAMEALNVWKVTHLQQINIWSNPMKRYAKIPRLSGQTLLICVLFGGSVVVFAFAQYYKSATQWSCLGHFTKETSNLWLPVVLVNTCAALAASSFSYFSLFTMKNMPQYRQKMDSFLSGEDYLVKWSVEKCYRNAVFLFFLPWLLLASWITLAVSSDWVTDITLNILTVVFSIAYSAANILQSFITDPSMYSLLVSYAMIILPNGCSPMQDPVMMRKRSEVLKQRKMPKESKKQLGLPRLLQEGYLPVLVREHLHTLWTQKYLKGKAEKNCRKVEALYAVYIDESESGQNNLRSTIVSDQIRFLVLKWMLRTKMKDPQQDLVKATRYDFENLFNVIGSLKVLRPGRMDFQSDDNIKILEDYNALFVYDPFQVCSLSVMGADGCTKSMKSLRTPIGLLQNTPSLDKASPVNNGNTQNERLDTRSVLSSSLEPSQKSAMD